VLKMDPLELRLINHADEDPEKKLPWSSKKLFQNRRCLGVSRFAQRIAAASS
jgi:xanthine dehydrogenase YagR molybdenum-binding subunit